MPEKVAIVILNWNGVEYLKKFLPAVLAFSSNEYASVYVADNASTDNSVDVLKAEFPSVKIIVLDQNYGFAGGYNHALAQIEAEYYLILNSDVEVTENWLNPLVEYMDNQSDVAACQPKILAYHDKQKFEHAGAAGGFIDRLGYPFCRGRILAITEEDRGQYDDICEIFWTTGACMLIRSALFHEAGGFDANFFAHMEEIDLCWRLKSMQHRLVCIPQSKVYHVGGGTLQVENPRKTYLNFRNNLLLLYKNLPSNRLQSVLFLRFFMDYLAAFQLFVTGKPHNAAAVFRARRDYSKMKKNYAVTKGIHNESIPEIYKGSIIFNYYLRGKKRHSDL
jgi:GT2 family glycosyltransferase